MTQGFPGYGAPPQQPQQFAAPQGYAPPQPQFQQPPAPAPQPGGFFQTQDPHMQAAGQVPPQPPAPAQTPADTSGFFGGAASISFDDRKGYVRGTPRGGQVLDKTISNQTKLGTGEVITWSDGSPRKQMVVTLQTAERTDPQDNGQRQLFIKGDLPRAVREAMQAVGAQDVEVGGWLYAAWVDEKPAKSASYNPQKIYKAVYARPGSPDPMAGHPAYQTPAQPLAAPAPQQSFAPPGQEMYPGQNQPQYVPTAQAQQPQTGGFPAQQFQPTAPQPGQFPQPGAPQANTAGVFQQPQQPAPSGQQPAEWTPFSP